MDAVRFTETLLNFYKNKQRHTPEDSTIQCKYIATCRGVVDYRRSMDLILDFLTPLGTASKYDAIANLHTLKITTAPAEHFPVCRFFNSRSLATASNSGDPSCPANITQLNSH
jgi:hypothetical protein